MKELVIADVVNHNVSAYTTEEKAQADLEEVKAQNIENIAKWESYCKEHPEEKYKTYLKKRQSAQYEIMSLDEFLTMKRKDVLSTPLKEISEEKYNEMFNMSPPLHHCSRDNVELFCMNEMVKDSNTYQYAHDRNTGKYYTKMVDSRDPFTWISEVIKKDRNSEIER